MLGIDMAKKSPRLTRETMLVLGAISDVRHAVSGSMIAKSANLSSGTLYPILIRLEGAGWLTSVWESDDPQALGRPRRRLYTITGKGLAHMRSAARELAPFGRLQWT
jgi:DNA-binding PadR family transcriptional regulator